MAGAYGKAGKHLALARRCVLDGRLTHPPDGKRRGVRGGGVWPACGRPYQGREPLAPALVRAARARRPPRWAGMSSYPLGRAGGAGPGIWAPALAPGPRALAAGLPGQAGGAAVSARLRRAETKAPAAMAAGAKKGFALPPPPSGGRPGEAEGPAVTSSSARRGCPSGGGNGAACHRIGSRLPQWRERWGWR